MTFAVFHSFLALPILAALCVASVRSEEIYSVAGNDCRYAGKSKVEVFEPSLVKPTTLFAVPEGYGCFVRYEVGKGWACRVSREAASGKDYVVIARGIKKPETGKALRPNTSKATDVYLAPEGNVKFAWAGKHGVFYSLETQRAVCIEIGTRHPRLHGVRLEITGEGGARKQGIIFDDFKAKESKLRWDLDVTNRAAALPPNKVYAPVYELHFDPHSGSWVIEQYKETVLPHYVIGRAIAIIPKTRKSAEATNLKFELTKAGTYPVKNAVAYIMARLSSKVEFHGKKMKVDENLTPVEGSKKTVEAVKIDIGSISLPASDIPIPLPPLTHQAAGLVADGPASEAFDDRVSPSQSDLDEAEDEEPVASLPPRPRTGVSPQRRSSPPKKHQKRRNYFEERDEYYPEESERPSHHRSRSQSRRRHTSSGSSASSYEDDYERRGRSRTRRERPRSEYRSDDYDSRSGGSGRSRSRSHRSTSRSSSRSGSRSYRGEY